jgi:hypothetical protein
MMGEDQAKADKLADRANKEQLDAIHEQEKADKEDAKERHAWLEDIKKNRIEALQDQADAVRKKQHDFDEAMWDKQHMGGQAQIMSGAKTVVDYYQTGGGTDQKALAKEAHAQREKTNKELEAINAQLKKERRLVVPN